MKKSLEIYPAAYFERQNEENDALFYETARNVVHIDELAIDMLEALYADVLPVGGSYLDLMASWRSHLPFDQLRPSRVAGLGLNSEEMVQNPQLSPGDIWVRNLNVEPVLPFAEGEFDAVLCAVSVQYLIQPLEVFAEVNRVLKPGGPFVVSFSNRCFPTKATAVWLETGDQQHIELVASYYFHSAGWGEVQARIKSRNTGASSLEDPLFILWGEKVVGS